MRVGLIGIGRIGGFHARTLSGLTEVSELVIADAREAQAAETAAALGASSAASPAALLAMDLDALVIASATSSHAELIAAAAERGVPAFCEKPIALDLAGTHEALRTVEASGTLLQIGFMRRFDAGYTAAREAVGSGRLGRLHTVRATTSDPAPPPAAYLPLSGGLYRDCLVHDFDAVRWVTGQEVVSVFAVGSDAGPPAFREAGDVDTAAALLTLESGTLCTATATRLNGAGYDVRMELAGEKDQVTAGLTDRTPLTQLDTFPSAQLSDGPSDGWVAGAAGRSWPGFLERFAPAYETELAAFLRAARGEIPNPCDGREALEALLVAEACELSRRTGRPVRPSELR